MSGGEVSKTLSLLTESRARKDTAARMPQGEVIEFNFKSPVPAGFKSPAQKRLESRAQETYSPKSFAEIQAQLENADVNRKVPDPEITDFEMTGCLLLSNILRKSLHPQN